MSMRRMNRLTNAFSKKMAEQQGRVIAAMESGFTDHIRIYKKSFRTDDGKSTIFAWT